LFVLTMPRSTLAAATSTPSSVRKNNNPMGEDWSLVRMLEGLLPTSLTKAAAQDRRKAEVAEAAEDVAEVANSSRVSEETKRQAREASERWKRSRSDIGGC
jgi:hypothetical protein